MGEQFNSQDEARKNLDQASPGMQPDHGALARLRDESYSKTSRAGKTSQPILSRYDFQTKDQSESQLAPADTLSRLRIISEEGGKEILPGMKNALTSCDHLSLPFGKQNESIPIPRVLENLGAGVAIGFAARTLLPETGILGKLGSVALGAYFTIPALTSGYRIYNDARNARTMQELRGTGQEIGDTLGSLAVSLPLGYAGYKAGDSLGTKLLASKPMAPFAQAKLRTYDALNQRIGDGIDNMAANLKGALGVKAPDNYTGSHLLTNEMLEKTPATVDTKGTDYPLPKLPPADPSYLKGKNVVIISADGPEAPELLVPLKYLKENGANVKIAGQDWIFPYRKPAGTIVMGEWLNVDHSLKADMSISQALDLAKGGKVDALIVPGGAWNPDMLRTDASALNLVKTMVSENKLVASICHGPQVLVSSEAFPKGTEITGVDSIRIDLRNAGFNVHANDPVVFDARSNLLTSRNPNDLGPFVQEIGRRLNDSAPAPKS